MSQADTPSQFDARLLRPRGLDEGNAWAFVILPEAASAKLPRRGRTTVAGTIAGRAFTALLEPDGRKSHWLKIDAALLRESDAEVGDLVHFEIRPVEQEPEPEVPPDLNDALRAVPDAWETWEGTTTIARVDWVHWIGSAKQPKTRAKRVLDACDMLASGKKRVCCFDPSGFYSKAFAAPQAVDEPAAIK